MAIGVGVALIGIWWFVAFGSGIVRFIWRTSLLAGLGVGVFMVTGYTHARIKRNAERIRLEMHKQRGDQFSPRTFLSLFCAFILNSVLLQQHPRGN